MAAQSKRDDSEATKTLAKARPKPYRQRHKGRHILGTKARPYTVGQPVRMGHAHAHTYQSQTNTRP